MKTCYSFVIAFLVSFCSVHVHASPQDIINTNQSTKSDLVKQAVWQKQDTRFWYTGNKTHYSCQAIEQKLETLLLHFGAKDSPTIKAQGCFNDTKSSSQSISVSLSFYVPVELMTDEDADKAFAAHREPVLVSNHTPIQIETFDCELIDSFAQQVLPKFDQEVVRKKTACFRRQSSLHAWYLESKVLVASIL